MASKYRANDAGVAKARQMIDSHHYDLDAEWGDAAPSTETANDKIDSDGYDGYGGWHLAIDTEASDDTKDRFNFPFGDFQRVVRSALIAAKQRAAQNDHDAIEKAAARPLAAAVFSADERRCVRQEQGLAVRLHGEESCRPQFRCSSRMHRYTARMSRRRR